MKKRDEFDSAGEAKSYISLDQAVLQAMRMAKQDEAGHARRLGWEEMVWVQARSEEREDSYVVVLEFRPPGRDLSKARTGEEEFIFDHTGELIGRQVLVWPETASIGPPPPPEPPPEVNRYLQEARRRRLEEAGRRIEKLKHLFPVSSEATQYYMDAFVLASGETVLLDIPVDFPMRYVGFTWWRTGKMGITHRRLLFSKRPFFGRGHSEGAIRNIREVRTRPGPRGIELVWEYGPERRRTHRGSDWVAMSNADHRELLAEDIRFEAAGSH